MRAALLSRVLVALATVALLVTGTRPAAAGAPTDTVAFAGDSIGRDAESLIRAFVEPEHTFVHYETVPAGSVPYHHPILLNVVRRPGGPDIVILEVGTGDAFWEASEAVMEANARAMLDDISPHVDCIRWLDIKNGGTLAFPTVNAYAAGVNRAIHRVVEDYPKAEYVHYEAWTRLAGLGYFVADRLHHNHLGGVELARLVNMAVDSCDPALTSGPYWDVRDDHWAAPDIAWMHQAGIADGYANGTYRAVVGGFKLSVTRGQMANFLWHLAGSPTGHPDHPWTDGPAWIDQALDWLAATGIANGYPDGTFRPGVTVQRGEVANFLWRLAGSPTGHPDHPWTDGPAWIDQALDWLAATGIADGYPDGTFRPRNPLTRAQMAHLLHGYALLPAAPAAVPQPDVEPPPPDGPPTDAPPAPPPPSTTAPPSTLSPTTAPPATTTSSPTPIG